MNGLELNMLMDWNYKCLWDLNSLNCLMVPSTNNGNEGANSRFLLDFWVHPNFWSFCLDACSELERDNADIPSIMYGTLIPAETPLYSALKEQREVVMANFELSLIDLDGYLGKIGSISLRTGMAKSSADDEESGSLFKRHENPPFSLQISYFLDPPVFVNWLTKNSAPTVKCLSSFPIEPLNVQ